ncbi:MAG: protein kinase [Planctomycetes bacterium]|nr:protein kinase [Planctomycetota bacterium]
MNETSDVLRQILERPEAEWESAVAEQCASRPDLADRLRQRFAILRESGFVGAASGEARVPHRLGEFTLGRVLGQGGMGVVYEARQERLGRSVALKLVRPEHLLFPGARERFRREVEAVARLSHPSIVAVFTVGEADSVPYFAMELLHGASLDAVLEEFAGRDPNGIGGADLADVVARRAGVDRAGLTDMLFTGDWQQVCLTIGRRLAEALAHAHARGVVHRDVKPSNVVITPEGRVVLLDFGLALPRGVDRMTRDSAEVGSVPYMAPEQLRGEPGDARTDVYSLGVTLRELLGMRQPFLSSDREQTRRTILTGAGASLQQQNPAVSWELLTVLHAATDVQPENRYQTATRFAADLANVAARRPITARPAGTLRRLVRWAQRRPALATGIVLGLLTVTTTPSAIAIGIAEQRNRARAAEAAAQAKNYEANLAAANNALQVIDKQEAQRRLQACPEPRRGFEWHHLSLALDGGLAVLAGHAAEVTAVAMTDDAGVLASGDRLGEVVLWDVRRSEAVHRFAHHGGRPVQWLAFSADGSRLWIADHEQHLSTVDTGSRAVLARRPPANARERVWLGVHGESVLAIAGGWQVDVLDPATLQRRTRVEIEQTGTAPHSLLTADRRHLCALDDGLLQIWDLDTGRRVGAEPRAGACIALAMSVDGRLLAARSDDGRISVHRADDASLVQAFSERLRLLPTTAFTRSGLCFDRRGELLAATGPDGALRVFDLESGTLVSVRTGHEGRVNGVAFGGAGMLVATAGEDRCVRLWSPYCGRDVQVLEGHAGVVRQVAVTDDGRRIVSVSEDGALRVWDAASGLPVATFGGFRHHANTLAIIRGGKAAVSSYHDTLLTFDLETMQPAGSWGTALAVFTDLVAGADGRLLAAGTEGRTLLLDPSTRRVLRELNGHQGVVTACALASSNEAAFTGGVDGRLLRWDLRDDRPPVTLAQSLPIRDLHLRDSTGLLAVARGGLRARGAVTDQGEVSVVTTAGEVLWRQPCSSPATAVVLLPDASRVVSGHLDGTLAIWDAATGAIVLVRQVIASSVRALASEPGGRWLVAGDETGNCYVVAAQRPLPGGSAFAAAAAAAGMRMHSCLRGQLLTPEQVLEAAARADHAKDLLPVIEACERCAPLMTWKGLIIALKVGLRPGLPAERYAQAGAAAEAYLRHHPDHALSLSVAFMAAVRLGQATRALELGERLQRSEGWQTYEPFLRAGLVLARMRLGHRDAAAAELQRLQNTCKATADQELISVLREAEAALR